MNKSLPLAAAILLFTFLIAIAATNIQDFFLPGSQIGQSGNIETPDKCDNCHGGYDLAVEPAFNWRGSMMAQAARDPLFYACLAIANQDAPDVGDLCLRCHTPDGWLNGRCEPTDGSALNSNDRQGVQCDFCHKLVKPTPLGTNPFPGDENYNKSVYGTVAYNQDQSYLAKIIPIPGTTANGMYIADDANAKRGPFANATGRHQMVYSPFHKESALCGTCHDVSNPAFIRQNTTDEEYVFIKTLGIDDSELAALNFDLRHMFPVERTYSEWLASGYNKPGGKSCQDCHMKDVTGKGAKMKDAPLRTDLPLHDFTGGNTFVPHLVKDLYASEVNAAALDAGIERSRQQLKAAADMLLTLNGTKTELTVKVINKTGHKLPTGYPEGRRMWINVKFYNADNGLVAESGAYNPATAKLTVDGTKIYECKPGISEAWVSGSGKPKGASFHFAINNKIWFDNRIPPAGFTNDGLIYGQSPVVDSNGDVTEIMYPDGQNYDVTNYIVPSGTIKIEVKLLYQTTSKEYVEFLRDENHTNNAGQVLYDLWVKHGMSAPEIMNEGTIYTGTPPPPPVSYMDAGFIKVTRQVNRKQTNGYAEVRVKTSTGAAVAGATVLAQYSGPTSGSLSVLTDATGLAILKTKAVNSPIGQWCFTITDVQHTGFEYNIPEPLTSMCEPVGTKSLNMPESPIAENTLTVYPNPTSGQARINYSVAEPGQTRLVIFNSSGQQVAILEDRFMSAGEHTATWDGVNYPNGAYYFRLTNNQEVVTRPLILNK